VLGHQSIVPADAPEAMSRSRSRYCEGCRHDPSRPAVVPSAFSWSTSRGCRRVLYHATPAAAVELLATISSLPSRSRSATARLVTPVAAASIVNAVQAPGAFMVAVAQGVAVQGFCTT